MTNQRNLFNTRNIVVLSRSDRKDYGVFMEQISEETEHNLDKQSNLKGDFTYITANGRKIYSRDTYLYGEINLDNPKDIKYLDRFNKAILNPYDIGNWYYTSFDYETGTITKDANKNVYLGINFIMDYIKWFKFKYCILGKPKRIIIYKYPIINKLDA